MPAWLTFTALRKLPWRYIVLALAAAAVLFSAYRWARGIGYHARDGEVVQLTTRAEEAERSVARLKVSLVQQNAAVSALKTDADKRAAQGVEALREAQTANKRQIATIASLRKSAKVIYSNEAPCWVSRGLSNVEGL